MNEEEIYELISEEIETGNTKDGLWTKAYSKSDGDENKTKALYIKYRFDQIKQTQPQVDEENIVKGKKFESWRKVGSLYQAIKIYNLREVDELIFLDINSTNDNLHSAISLPLYPDMIAIFSISSSHIISSLFIIIPVVVINKIDKYGAEPDRVMDEVFDFLH